MPMNLVMIVDIFKCNENMPPSTVTQLYQLFIVMTLRRQVKKDNKRKQVHVAADNNNAEEKLCKVLAGVPKEVVNTLMLLCRLAHYGIFYRCS